MAISPDDTAETLAPRLSETGAALMVETLHKLSERRLAGRPQDHALATLAPILKKEDGQIDFRRSAREICNRLRGFQPWPGAFTTFRGKHLQVWRAESRPGEAPPGTIVTQENSRLLAGCGEHSLLEIVELQLEGKKRMAARDFLHGYRPAPGERFIQDGLQVQT